MARFQGTWIPETQREATFVADLNELTQDAYKDGVDRDDLASALAFQTGVIADYAPDDPTPEAEYVADPPAKTEECPECGGDLDDVLFSMGGVAEARPCGCTVDTDDLEGWVDV